MSEYKIRIAKALERIAEHLAAKDPVPSGTPDPEQRYEPTEKDFTLWNYLKKHGGTSLKGRKPARDLSLTTLPGEQVAVAMIELFKTLFEAMDGEQKKIWLTWMLEDQKAWRKFWGIGKGE